MMNPTRVILLWAACGAMWIASCASGAELEVGPGKRFTRIEEAMKLAAAGDVIVVTPTDQPYARVALFVTKPRLTFRSADPHKQVRIDGKGFDYSGRGSTPRAIVQFNPGADGCVFEGFDLTGAHNDSHNGAGVRINASNDVTIRNCTIHDNDMGIMSNGSLAAGTGTRQFIDRCHIYNNGSLKEPGYNHNLYLGGTSVLVRGCDIHSSLTGHNLKSRAHQTWIEYCHIHDSANRELDLVDDKENTAPSDSDAVLIGNAIVKRANMTGNKAVIHFGQDGGHEHNGSIHLIHNTILTPYQSPVVDLSAKSAGASLVDNLIFDSTGNSNHTLISARKGATLDHVTGGGNQMSQGFASVGAFKPSGRTLTKDQVNFIDAAHADYRLMTPIPPNVPWGHWQLPPRPLGENASPERYQSPCRVSPLPAASISVGIGAR